MFIQQSIPDSTQTPQPEFSSFIDSENKIRVVQPNRQYISSLTFA
jgi:hypothetical protein